MVDPKPEDVEIPEDTTWEELSSYQRYYYKNRDKEVNRVQEREEKIREYLKQYKEERGCQRCPETHPACLVFHHNEPGKKEYDSASMVQQGLGIEAIDEELRKCTVLCANCHRKHHAENDKVP